MCLILQVYTIANSRLVSQAQIHLNLEGLGSRYTPTTSSNLQRFRTSRALSELLALSMLERVTPHKIKHNTRGLRVWLSKQSRAFTEIGNEEHEKPEMAENLKRSLAHAYSQGLRDLDAFMPVRLSDYWLWYTPIDSDTSVT